jgi:hypothetical protein
MCTNQSVPLRHHNLVAWQRADDLYIHVHELVRQSFPNYERFELGSQIRRAAYSVPANIVEGFALAEVGYCLHAARRLDYISDEAYGTLELEVRQVASPLSGLIRLTRGR